MKTPKPAEKPKKPVREVTLTIPAKSYDVFAKADREIQRQFRESPGVEVLMVASLESERSVEQLVAAYHSRMLSKSNRMLVDVGVLSEVVQHYLQANREIKKRAGKSPGAGTLMSLAVERANLAQLVEEFSKSAQT